MRSLTTRAISALALQNVKQVEQIILNHAGTDYSILLEAVECADTKLKFLFLSKMTFSNVPALHIIINSFIYIEII
jgi:hypothetical protein